VLELERRAVASLDLSRAESVELAFVCEFLNPRLRWLRWIGVPEVLAVKRDELSQQLGLYEGIMEEAPSSE
jgi:hypothetical protein